MTSERSQVQNCVRCDTSEQSLIDLSCSHPICLICLSYISIKAESRSQSQSFPSCIACPLCLQETTLNQACISKIKTTIENVVVPKFHQGISQDPEECSIQQEEDEQQDQEPQRTRCERETHVKLTGVTTMNQSSIDMSLPARSIASRCSSPSIRSKSFCRVHPFQQLMFCCSDCGNEFLCLKCYADSRHTNHTIRSITKTIDLLSERMGFSKLELLQKLELMELTQRRLSNRQQLIKSRLKLSKQRVSQTVQHLIQSIKKKQCELYKQVESHFARASEQIQQQISSIKERIQLTRGIATRIKISDPYEKPFEFIKSCTEIEQELQNKDEPLIEVLSKLSATKDILQITNDRVIQVYHSVSRLTVNILETDTFMSLKERLDTVPSLRAWSHQKLSRTQKTDPGEGDSLKLSKIRVRNFQQTHSNVSPTYISQFLSRQLSCQNIHQQDKSALNHSSYKPEESCLHYQSFATQSKTPCKERKQRRTTGTTNVMDRSIKMTKTMFQKKLKKSSNKQG